MIFDAIANISEHALVERQHAYNDQERYAPAIRRSRLQCRKLGLVPERFAPITPTHRSPSGNHQTLRSLASTLEDLYEFVEGTSSAILLSDEVPCIIDLVGDTNILDGLHQRNLVRGSLWCTERIGTNALALALVEGHPLPTVGDEHYCTALQDFAVAAAPLFGPSGQLLGGIAIVMPAESYSPHVLGMIGAAAQSIHTQLQMQQLVAETNHHLTELNAALETMSEGMLLISADGRIAKLNQHVEQLLGISARSAAGCSLTDVLRLPRPLQQALEQRSALPEQELVFKTTSSAIGVVCTLKPIYQQEQYIGALLTLHQPDRIRSLVHQIVGAQAQISFSDIVGESPALHIALSQARSAAHSIVNVLLVGEHGTGKELLARAIHQASSRASGPFVTLNCATVPRTLIGSELFGYESTLDRLQPGRPGKLELAQGGTLLLKAIDALPMEEQTTLLRAIEARNSIRLGGRRVVPLDVRIIATTTSGLGVDSGRFRPDLAACLSAYSIELPALRTRGYDILLLIDHFLEVLNQRLGKQLVLSPEATHALTMYPWPGNIRELEAVLEQVAHTTEQSVLFITDLPTALRQLPGWTDRAGNQLQTQHAHIEREAILRTARATGGHLGRTAQQLGISRSTLWRKMREHGLSRMDLVPLGT